MAFDDARLVSRDILRYAAGFLRLLKVRGLFEVLLAAYLMHGLIEVLPVAFGGGNLLLCNNKQPVLDEQAALVLSTFG